jgi:hypothetical protein
MLPWTCWLLDQQSADVWRHEAAPCALLLMIDLPWCKPRCVEDVTMQRGVRLTTWCMTEALRVSPGGTRLGAKSIRRFQACYTFILTTATPVSTCSLAFGIPPPKQ